MYVMSYVINVMEEHQKEVDADFKRVEQENMRRGKPPQEIYKPGSGKLRRSNQGADDSLSESGSTSHSQGSVIQDNFRSKSETSTELGGSRDSQKRTRKPERELYVPRPFSQGREQLSPQYPQSYGQESVVNGSDNSLNSDKMNRSKRYSSNRNNQGDNGGRGNNHNEWRDESPGSNRNIRMGSEPRGVNNGSNWSRDRDRDRHRERDTRSVEPTGMGNRNNHNDGKIQAKPPSGRRHSTTGNFQFNNEQERKRNMLKNLENLPPRLRKKYMEDNGLTPDDVGWDGSTSVYQSSAPAPPPPQPQHNMTYHSLEAYSTLPHSAAQSTYNTNQNMGYHTLPSRPRGRGRLYQEPEFQPGPAFRSMTPERASMPHSPGNSRPGTPTRRFDSRPPSRPPSRSQTPVNHYEDNNRYYNESRGSGYREHGYREQGSGYREQSSGYRDDRGGSKPNAYDRVGPRGSEPRQTDRERDRRNDEMNMQRRGDDNRNRRGDENRNRRNEFNQERRGDGDRDRSERDRKEPRRNDRRKRGGRDKRSSSRDFNRQDSRDTNFSQESNRNIKEEPRPQPQIQPHQSSLQQRFVLDAKHIPEVRQMPEVRQSTEVRQSSEVRRNTEVKQSPQSQSNQTIHQSVRNDVDLLDSVAKLSLQSSAVSSDKAHDVKGESVEEEREILDWNEEVELDHKLEAEAFSDALTRSSSVTSLQEMSTRSMPSSTTTTTPNTKKKRKSGRRKSKQRSGSGYRDKTPTNNNRNRKDSVASIESRDRDNFKVPQEPGGPGHHRGRRGRRSSKDQRDASFDRFHNKSRGPSRDVSFDRSHSSGMCENWREEIIRSRQNSEREDTVPSHKTSSDRSRRNSELDDHLADTPTKQAGILVLPSRTSEPPQLTPDRPKFPEIRKSPNQKTLFDPNNPKKPILVKAPGSRVAVPGFSGSSSETGTSKIITDQYGKVIPNWYDETREEFKQSYFPDLLRDIKRADMELQHIINNGMLLVNYETVDNLRQFLNSALEYMLCKAIKFCQTENVEQHVWKILYYNIIEVTRKAIANDPENKQQYKGFLLYLIDEGTKYFERLLGILEEIYKFKVVDYIGNNSMVQHKKLGFTGLALVSAQKIFLCLGDLGRYREQVNETSNYGKCRQWYIKSHEINPKNGKPYNRLAVLAVFSRRKLDAVYYYMRSLMSSNPVPSAKENLISLFDENRKKYEQGEKKRREERLERQRQHMKQKESEENGTPNFLRKETWIHPEGGRRLHRTTKALHDELQDSEEEDLASLSSVDVNKRFVISYLHVHGKLITKIGLESFQDAAMQMLKEFRALLQHSPVPLPCNRFLQLLALNMFAIESTQLKDLHLQQSAGYRSELQERALIVSLQMFNLILDRCVSILQDHVTTVSQQDKPGLPLDSLPHDANVLLPAIKIWCDWMLCHTSVWNPPPSTQDFKVGPSGDLWSRLGLLMNILERIDQNSMEIFANEPQDGYEAVRLPEDATLCGFTPLMFNDEAAYAPPNFESEAAQLRLRMAKLLFFGTVYLCGLEPPVLKLEIEDGRRDYVSVVSRDSPREEAVLTRSGEILLETFSGDEDEAVSDKTDSRDLSPSCDTSSEVKDLLTRKSELEKRKRSQDLHKQRVMKILSQSVVSVHLEIRPKYLIPDTNCFIDHLDSIQTVTKSHTYTLMVPIVVLSELEGLSKGTPSPTMRGKSAPSPEHVQKVAQASRLALEFLKTRHSAVKCVTTKGAVLASTSFCTEDDTTWDATMKNDDKILTTCLVLCKNHGKEQQPETVEGEPRHLVREVVLITEDRNLRVKAHARDVPVRALPDFMRWAGLGG